MSRSFEFDPVERITAGAVGEPGERVFYVQARSGYDQVTLLAEKEQVLLLAQALGQLLKTLEERGEEGPEPGEGDLDLHEPLEAEWRAGSMSIEYDEDVDRIVITINEAPPERDEEEAAVEEEGDSATARFVATRAQARAMAIHAIEVVAAGRPRCQFCGEPLEADEHICPAMNGHRRRE